MAKTINLTDFLKSYGKHTIKVRCRAEGFRNSDYASTEVENLPVIKYDATNNAIIVYNLLTDVTTYTLNIYDKEGTTLEYSQEYTNDGSSTSVSIDLSSFELTEGTVYTFEVAVVENDTTYTSASVKSNQVFGVSGMYYSSLTKTTTLTRTDDATDFIYTIDSSTGEIVSDFDDEFPYNQMVRETDSNGNVFVYVPAIWWRIGVDSSNNIMDIACSENEITTESPTGTTTYSIQTKAFYYGAYQGYVSNGVLYSKAGVTPTGSMTRLNFRKAAVANTAIDGYTHCQLDLYHKTILNFLWLIEFANTNSQAVMTGNINGAVQVTGRLDDVISTPSGYYVTNTTNTYNTMRYRYIEDFVGNMLEFYDGVYNNTYTTSPVTYTSSDSAIADSSGTKMSSITAYTPTGSGCVMGLGWDDDKPFICMPTEISGTSYVYCYADGVWVTSSNYPVTYGGAAYNSSSYANYGVWYCNYSTASSYSSLIGARLLKLPD